MEHNLLKKHLIMYRIQESEYNIISQHTLVLKVLFSTCSISFLYDLFLGVKTVA